MHTRRSAAHVREQKAHDVERGLDLLTEDQRRVHARDFAEDKGRGHQLLRGREAFFVRPREQRAVDVGHVRERARGLDLDTGRDLAAAHAAA